MNRLDGIKTETAEEYRFALPVVAFGCMVFYSYLVLCSPLPFGMDIPQHTLQVEYAYHLLTDWTASKQFVLDPYKPYALGYLLPVVLRFFCSAALAVALSLIFFQWLLWISIRRIFVSSGADPWWSILAFVLCFGHSYYMGFFSFLCGVPFVFFAFEQACRYTEHERRQDLLLLFVYSMLIFCFHPMLFGLAGIAIGSHLLANFHKRKARFLLLLVAILGLPATVWLTFHLGLNIQELLQVVGVYLDKQRVFSLLNSVSDSYTVESSGGLLALFLLLFFCFVKRQSGIEFLRVSTPFWLLLIFAISIPYSYKSIHVYQRLGVFLFVFLLRSFPAPINPICKWTLRSVVALYCSIVFFRMHNDVQQFDVRTRGIQSLFQEISPDSSLFYSVDSRGYTTPFYHWMFHYEALYAVQFHQRINCYLMSAWQIVQPTVPGEARCDQVWNVTSYNWTKLRQFDFVLIARLRTPDDPEEKHLKPLHCLSEVASNQYAILWDARTCR